MEKERKKQEDRKKKKRKKEDRKKKKRKKEDRKKKKRKKGRYLILTNVTGTTCWSRGWTEGRID